MWLTQSLIRHLYGVILVLVLVRIDGLESRRWKVVELGLWGMRDARCQISSRTAMEFKGGAQVEHGQNVNILPRGQMPGAQGKSPFMKRPGWMDGRRCGMELAMEFEDKARMMDIIVQQSTRTRNSWAERQLLAAC